MWERVRISGIKAGFGERTHKTVNTEKGLRNLWDQLPQILDKETGLNVKVVEVIQLVNKTSVLMYGVATMSITIISVITTDPFYWKRN